MGAQVALRRQRRLALVERAAHVGAEPVQTVEEGGAGETRGSGDEDAAALHDRPPFFATPWSRCETIGSRVGHHRPSSGSSHASVNWPARS